MPNQDTESERTTTHRCPRCPAVITIRQRHHASQGEPGLWLPDEMAVLGAEGWHRTGRVAGGRAVVDLPDGRRANVDCMPREVAVPWSCSLVHANQLASSIVTGAAEHQVNKPAPHTEPGAKAADRPLGDTPLRCARAGCETRISAPVDPERRARLLGAMGWTKEDGFKFCGATCAKLDAVNKRHTPAVVAPVTQSDLLARRRQVAAALDREARGELRPEAPPASTPGESEPAFALSVPDLVPHIAEPPAVDEDLVMAGRVSRARRGAR